MSSTTPRARTCTFIANAARVHFSPSVNHPLHHQLPVNGRGKAYDNFRSLR